jgi:hypothetical protein
MIKGVQNEIITGAAFVSGVVIALIFAETIPLLAGAGAVTSLVAGLYQAKMSSSEIKAARVNKDQEVGKSSTFQI